MQMLQLQRLQHANVTAAKIADNCYSRKLQTGAVNTTKLQTYAVYSNNAQVQQM